MPDNATGSRAAKYARTPAGFFYWLADGQAIIFGPVIWTAAVFTVGFTLARWIYG